MCVCLRRTITKVYAVACRAAVAVVDEKTKEKLIEKKSGLYEAAPEGIKAACRSATEEVIHSCQSKR